MSERARTTCEQCGQTDDHPKQHIMGLPSGDITKHYDCLSVSETAMVVESSATASTIIDAARSGTHGDDLLGVIRNAHKETV